MAHIETIAKPRSAKEHYQFFKNTETGNEWKAAIIMQNIASPAVVAGSEALALTTLALTVTVSPIKDGEGGKALRDELDRPIVIDSWTHTFTEVEMSAPDFDPQKRIVGIIAERIEQGEIKLAGNKRIKEFTDKWTGKTKLKMAPVTFVAPEPEGKPE